MADSPMWVEGTPGDNRYNAIEYRHYTETVLNGRQGVYPRSGGLTVSQRAAGANMSVDVTKGSAAILGTEDADQGMYVQHIGPATLSMTIAVSDASNPRIDVVGVQVLDSEYPSGGGGVNSGSVVVIQGTPAGSPAVPTLPDNFLPLAQVAVAANASSIVNANITDLRVPLFQRYEARIYRHASYSPAAGQAVVPFDTTTYDPAGLVTLGASAGFTIAETATYDIKFQCAWANQNATENVALYIFDNGASVSQKPFTFHNTVTNEAESLELCDQLRFTAGHLIQGVYAHGGSTAVPFTADASFMTIRKVNL